MLLYGCIYGCNMAKVHHCSWAVESTHDLCVSLNVVLIQPAISYRTAP